MFLAAREQRKFVEGAPQLKGAGTLKVFGLEVDGAADSVCYGVGVQKRRSTGEGVQACAGLFDRLYGYHGAIVALAGIPNNKTAHKGRRVHGCCWRCTCLF